MTGIAVLGLHRGGTSAVAGALHHLGVFMGDDLLPPSKTNPKGYFESRAFVEAHTAMMGGGWKNPDILGFNDTITKERYRKMVEGMMEHEVWAIKDPRLCYVLPALIQVLPEDYDLRIVAVHRDLLAVTSSLFDRGGHTWVEAQQITIRYMRVMLKTLNDCGKPYNMVHFPSFVQCPDGGAIARSLGIPASSEQIKAADDFLDPNLVHWGVGGARCPLEDMEHEA